MRASLDLEISTTKRLTSGELRLRQFGYNDHLESLESFHDRDREAAGEVNGLL